MVVVHDSVQTQAAKKGEYLLPKQPPRFMAASSADIRDILSLPGPSATPAAAPPRKPPKAQKPEGISRELYSLIGDHAPSLVAVQRPKPKLKQRPGFGKGKVHWLAEILLILLIFGDIEVTI